MKLFRDAFILFRNRLEVSGPLRRRQRRPNNPSPRGTSPRRYLIVPGDPYAPSGSLGDVAMLCAFIGSIRGCVPVRFGTLSNVWIAAWQKDSLGQSPGGTTPAGGSRRAFPT